MDTDFYICVKTQKLSGFVYYATHDLVNHENLDMLKKTCENDVWNATLFHSISIEGTENFYIYYIDDNETRQYLTVDPSNSYVIFVTNMEDACYFSIKSKKKRTDTFLFQANYISGDTVTGYYLNMWSQDAGVGIAFTNQWDDYYISFIRADSFSASNSSYDMLDGKLTAIYHNGNGSGFWRSNCK